MDQLERFRGSLLGLAVEDALGTTLEFRPPGIFIPITDRIGGGPFDLEPGEWTDDTSMALCLAESLIERKEFDPIDQLERYVQWWRHGHLSSTNRCFDIGFTVEDTRARFERSREPYGGSADPWSAGNDSIMRLAPVPLFYARHPVEAIEKSGQRSPALQGVQMGSAPLPGALGCPSEITSFFRFLLGREDSDPWIIESPSQLSTLTR